MKNPSGVECEYFFGDYFRLRRLQRKCDSLGLLVVFWILATTAFFLQVGWGDQFSSAGFNIVLASTVFALLGFVNAIFAKKFDDISIVPTFVLTPLTYLGGVFYSIALLPEFWQAVSRIKAACGRSS